MAADEFEVDVLLVSEKCALLAGDAEPIGIDYPVGSLYMRTNGDTWKKRGPLVSDWVLFQTPYAGSVEIDFGAFGAHKNEAKVSVPSVGVAMSSAINLRLQLIATAEHNADEHQACGVELLVGTITPGVGFDIIARSRQGWDHGKFNVHWSY